MTLEKVTSCKLVPEKLQMNIHVFFKVTFDDWDGAGNDYGLGGGNNAKQLTLRGKDNVAEKVRVWQGPGLFSKDFKVVEVWRIDSKIF